MRNLLLVGIMFSCANCCPLAMVAVAAAALGVATAKAAAVVVFRP